MGTLLSTKKFDTFVFDESAEEEENTTRWKSLSLKKKSKSKLTHPVVNNYDFLKACTYFIPLRFHFLFIVCILWLICVSLSYFGMYDSFGDRDYRPKKFGIEWGLFWLIDLILNYLLYKLGFVMRVTVYMMINFC